jgi:hypothetical protein
VRQRPLLVLLSLTLLAASCTGGGPDEVPSAAPEAGDLAVAIASFDVSAGDDQRLLAGVFTPTRELLVGGTIRFELGLVDDAGDAALDQQVDARWLAVPGMEPADQSGPRLLAGEPGSGVYEARVDLDTPGVWALRVVADVDGEQWTGQTAFTVQPEPLVPAVGDPAPLVPNLTIADVEAGEVPASAVDSRALAEDGEIPDPHLHDTVITEAIEAGRPVVVGITTPVFCQSRFCGPLTEVLADLAREHADAAEFVHVEVWHDFESQQLTDAAAAWIQTEIGGNEPWVFLVGADGRIVARWDNVLDVAELEERLATL